jgi:hypothetical protein
MIYKNSKSNSGFIALMSAIIISVILLLIITNTSLMGFYTRFNILDSELKEKSSTLAEGCVDKALLNLTQGINYTGDVNVGPDKCTIESVSGSPKIIKVRADYRNYITNIEVEVDSNLAITNWQELP